MSTLALASIVVGYLCALAVQCVLWFAAYKAGLLLTALLLAIAAAIFAGVGAYIYLKSVARKSPAATQKEPSTFMRGMKWWDSETNPVVLPQ